MSFNANFSRRRRGCYLLKLYTPKYIQLICLLKMYTTTYRLEDASDNANVLSTKRKLLLSSEEQFLKYYHLKAKPLTVSTKLRPIEYCNVRKVGNHKDAKETFPVLPTLIMFQSFNTNLGDFGIILRCRWCM